MSKSDKSRRRRHMPGHAERKKGYNRKMRRLTAQALFMDLEPPIKMAGFANKSFCCGNHMSDWRY